MVLLNLAEEEMGSYPTLVATLQCWFGSTGEPELLRFNSEEGHGRPEKAWLDWPPTWREKQVRQHCHPGASPVPVHRSRVSPRSICASPNPYYYRPPINSPKNGKTSPKRRAVPVHVPQSGGPNEKKAIPPRASRHSPRSCGRSWPSSKSAANRNIDLNPIDHWQEMRRGRCERGNIGLSLQPQTNCQLASHRGGQPVSGYTSIYTSGWLRHAGSQYCVLFYYEILYSRSNKAEYKKPIQQSKDNI
ncbi:UNVERIFIED_CONTAM: hypothetical protein FKN15_035802 [Acipenser sinensis]